MIPVLLVLWEFNVLAGLELLHVSQTISFNNGMTMSIVYLISSIVPVHFIKRFLHLAL